MQQIAQSRPNFPAWHRTSSEELMNTATHGLGFVMAVVGTMVMSSGVLANGDHRLIVGCNVYLFSLVAVYAMSTLSHGATSPRWKTLFRQLDQAFIYMLIVGTYTPFALAYLRGGWWWVLLVAMWSVAIAGFISKVFFAHRVDAVSVIPPLMLGWMPIIAIPELWRVAPSGAFAAIIAGGFWYTAGTLFLVNDQRVRHFHAAWHLFVIAGSTCHFMGMLVFVVRGGH